MKNGRLLPPERAAVATAAALAGLSLVPLAAATVGLYLAPGTWTEPMWRLLRATGAIGLSFLGAVHWGLAMAADGIDIRRTVAALCWSLVPALLGWTILVLETAGGATALLLGIGFSAQFVADRRAHRAGYCPQWYVAMRSRMTAIVLLCLVAALLTGEHH